MTIQINGQVKFKANHGKLWIKADLVEKVKGGYILNCGDTKGFFVRDTQVKPLDALIN